MINGMYTALFIASVVMLVLLISLYKDQISVYYILLFSFIIISNLGYMQLSDADSLKMALFANQVVYLGATYTPFFMLMCLADLCRFKVKKWIQIAYLVYASAMFFLISTTGVLDWYYRDVTLIIEKGVGYLVKDYGPLHNMYPVYLFVTLIFQFYIVIKSVKNKKEVSFSTGVSLISIMTFMVILYTVQKAMHFKWDIFCIAYVAGELVLLILLRRIRLYNVTAITADTMYDTDIYGFLLCDSKGKYLGSDAAARKWFPEICEFKVDRPVKEAETDFLKQVNRWINGEDKEEIKIFDNNGMYIEAKHSIVKKGKWKAIHCVYLRDDTSQREYTKLVESFNENLEKEVNQKTNKIAKIQNDIIISMASIVENRDNNTGGHIQRTSDVVRVFVGKLLEEKKFRQLTPEVADCIIKAAPLHDFGKIAIPDAILNKPGKFTDEEYEEMKKHSAKGSVIVARILKNSDDKLFKQIAVNVAHYHHEKWNGEGYPDRLKGTEIPFEARVMALADVFDALVSKRVYKESFSYAKAFSIINDSCGTHFDPELCKEFLKYRLEFQKLYDSYED